MHNQNNQKKECKHCRPNNKNPLARIYFFFLGTGALFWFLSRVIPKPSRAAYPCMRLAAPMASTFVLWLLGLGSSWFFLKQARLHMMRSRYIIAAAFLIGGAIGGAVLISMSHSETMAAVKANTPIGVAKGVNPGRVVWIHDSSVSDWRGPGDGHWWQNANTKQEVVDQMLARSIRELSGKSTDSNGWDTLFKYYHQSHGRGNKGYTIGEKIVIKTNFTFCNHFPDFCCVDSMTYSFKKKFDYMNTSPQMILALLRQLVNVVGVKQSDIAVGDPVAYFPNEFYDPCHSEFPDVEYLDYAGKFGRTKVEFSSSPIYWSCRPSGLKQDFVPKQFAEASYIINLANMKSHMGNGITLCAKNHYGSLIRLPTEGGYYDLHTSLPFMTPQMGSYRSLVDIMGHRDLGGKTLLYVIDGLYAGNHNNDTVPHKWNVAPFNGGWTSSVFASQDPVAIESVLFDLFQLDDDPYQYPKIAGVEDYLIEAALANNPPSGTFYDPNNATATERLQSLGTCEHWNNVIDRKYSRNLGTGNGIELVFINKLESSVRLFNDRNLEKEGYSIRQLSGSGLIKFTIPKDESIQIELMDEGGRKVRTINKGFLYAGSYTLDLRNTGGKSLGSRIYTAIIKSNSNGKKYASAKMILIN